MKKAFVFLSLLICAATVVNGQTDAPKPAKKPNLPGTFLVDLGVNRGLNTPANFKQAFWGSRTVNVYYQYPIRFGRTKFSFNPGIGLSMERWKFNNGATLIDTVELVSFPNGAAAAEQVEQYNLLSPTRIYPKLANKSQLVTNYLEIPLEFRFDTSPEDLARSFNVALGGRVGILYDAFTKIRYNDNGEKVKVKNKMNHGVNPIRYGVYGRVGIGSFSTFVFYNLSEMFEKDKGPNATTMNTLTVGISINGF